MIRMDSVLARTVTMSLSYETNATINIYSDQVTQEALFDSITTALPADNLLVTFPGVSMELSATGFAKIRALSAAAQNAKGLATGTAKWFALATVERGTFVGEIGEGHALRLVGGNSVTRDALKNIATLGLQYTE